MRLISHALFSGQFLIALMDTSVGVWVLGVWVGGGVGGSCETMIIIIFSFSRILLKMEIHSH